MNVVVCVKQIPDPAVPGELDPETTRSSARASSSSTSPTATASRWRCSSSTRPAGARSTLVSMAPNDEVSGLRTALAMGAAKAILVSDDAAARAPTRCRPPRCIAKASSGPATSTSCSPRPSRPTATPARSRRRSPSCSAGRRSRSPSTSRSATARSKIQRQTEAGYDVVEASLPAVVSVTAGVVEPRYPSFKGIMAAKNKPVDQVTVGRPRPRRRPGRLGRRPPGDHERRGRARARRPARRSRTTATRTSSIVAFLEQLKVI